MPWPTDPWIESRVQCFRKQHFSTILTRRRTVICQLKILSLPRSHLANKSKLSRPFFICPTIAQCCQRLTSLTTVCVARMLIQLNFYTLFPRRTWITAAANLRFFSLLLDQVIIIRTDPPTKPFDVWRATERKKSSEKIFSSDFLSPPCGQLRGFFAIFVPLVVAKTQTNVRVGRAARRARILTGARWSPRPRNRQHCHGDRGRRAIIFATKSSELSYLPVEIFFSFSIFFACFSSRSNVFCFRSLNACNKKALFMISLSKLNAQMSRSGE